MDAASRIFIAGSSTMVGLALHRMLEARGFSAVINGDLEPNLRDAAAVETFFQKQRPEFVFVTAGRTAGIAGNLEAPADLMLDNLRVASAVIPAAWNSDVKKLLYLASSCTFPKLAPQPLNVSSLWTGPLEPSSESYATAKLAGMQLCTAYRRQHGASFIAAISADAYGPFDSFDTSNSHVAAALLRRMHDAKIAGMPAIEVWGTGTPRREFIFVDDLADACLFTMDRYEGEAPLNLGVGVSTSIAELAAQIQRTVDYPGEIRFDRTKPDGTPFKGLDSSALHGMGWQPRVDLATGLALTYDWFQHFS